MTIYRLHQAIKERVEQAVSEAGFQGLQVYIRNLPPLKYEGDAEKYFPHCLIGLEVGSDDNEKSSIEVILTFATKDQEPELKGYEKICHLIEITRLSLAEKPTLNGQFEIQKPIRFTLGSIEEETYPYFFGAVMFEVNIPSPGPDYSDLT